VSRLGRDPASWLLAGAARLLPPARGEWGRAMRAELAGIESGQARWRFALGCIRVVASQPAVLPGIGYPLLMAGVLVAVVTWTDTVPPPRCAGRWSPSCRSWLRSPGWADAPGCSARWGRVGQPDWFAPAGICWSA